MSGSEADGVGDVDWVMLAVVAGAPNMSTRAEASDCPPTAAG